MKNKILLLICSIQLVSACSKSGPSTPSSPTSPASSKGYIRLTISGKTLEARDTILNKGTTVEQFYPMVLGFTINPAGSGLFNKIVTINSAGVGSFDNGTLKMYCGAFSDSSKTNSPLDTYSFKYFNTPSNTVKDLTTSTVYPIDIPSTITVTQSNSDSTTGTLNLTLQGSGGSKISASGSFKVFHK